MTEYFQIGDKLRFTQEYREKVLNSKYHYPAHVLDSLNKELVVIGVNYYCEKVPKLLFKGWHPSCWEYVGDHLEIID